MLIFARDFYPLFVYHYKIFQKCSVGYVYILILLLVYLLRKRVCIHFWNVNSKYCTAITAVRQSLQPLDYAWLQQQHRLLWSHCVSFTFAWGYCRLLFKNFCILCSVPNRWWCFTAKLESYKGSSNFTRPLKSLGVVSVVLAKVERPTHIC